MSLTGLSYLVSSHQLTALTLKAVLVQNSETFCLQIAIYILWFEYVEEIFSYQHKSALFVCQYSAFRPSGNFHPSGYYINGLTSRLALQNNT